MAVFNGGFPASYQQYYNPYQMPQQAQQGGNSFATANNTIIWVQGLSGAKSYLVAPGATVPLWDSEDQKIYLKSADNAGIPSIRVLDYRIAPQTHENATNSVLNRFDDNLPEYATKTDLEAIRAQIEHLQKIVDGQAAQKPGKVAKNESALLSDAE